MAAVVLGLVAPAAGAAAALPELFDRSTSSERDSTGSAGSIGPRGPVGTTPATGRVVVHTLRKLLPEGAPVKDFAGLESPLGEAYGQVVWDDGRGAGRISVHLQDGFLPAAQVKDGAGSLYSCAARGAQSESCTTERLPDGGWLIQLSDRKDGCTRYTADRLWADGTRVLVSAQNNLDGPGAPANRESPPLDKDRMRAIATSAEWRPRVPTAVAVAAAEAVQPYEDQSVGF